MAKRFPALARGAVCPVSIDWARWIPTGATLSACTWALESGSNAITFSDEAINGTVSSATMTVNSAAAVGEYYVEATPTLDTGRIDPRHIPVKVVRYKGI